jgi:tetratricopeptide (TPR) repeat protein
MTLEYASPEQVRGEPVTPASDIFSLGVVLYRLLTGGSPYPASATTSDYELGKAICDTEPAPPSHGALTRPLKRAIKGDLDAVVMMALRKDPSRRYASAEALADDVFRHLEGLPVQARRGAWSYRAGRFVLRHRAVVGAALVANLALVAGLSFAAYEAYQAHEQKERAERHFASVRRLANTFIFDVHKAIERVPGSLPARQTLVTTALTYLEQLRQEAGSDPTLQLEIAAGYRHVGDVLGANNMSSLGRREEAMEHYKRAQRIVQGVAASEGPERLAAWHQLVLLDTRIGAMLDGDGHFAEAATVEEEGVRIGRRLVREQPTNYDYQRALSNQLIYQAQLYFHSDQEDTARKALTEAEEQLKRTLALRPGDIDVVANLAAVYGYRALQFLGDDIGPKGAALALAEFDKGIAVMAPAYAQHPDHLVLAPNYAEMHAQAGTALQRMKRYPEALAYQRKALEIKRALAARSPQDVYSEEGLAHAESLLAETLLAMQDGPQAIDAAASAARRYGALPAAKRATMVTQYDEGWVNYLLGSAWKLVADKAAQPEARAEALRNACRSWSVSLPLLVDNDKRQPIGADKDGPDTVRKAMKACPAGSGT